MPAPSVFGLSGSKINWEKMIKKIMKAYKRRLKIFKLNEWETQRKLEAWRMLRKKLQELRSAAKFLYDPIRGPFQTMKVEASDSRAFDATTTRAAKAGKYKIEILQTAAADVFQSDKLKQGQELQSGSFTIRSGKKKYTINFGGGTVHSLAKIINRVAGKIVNASVINIDGEHVALVIEGKKTGQKHKVYFSDISPLLLKIGLLEKRGSKLFKEDFSNQSNFRTRNGTVHLRNNTLILTPNSTSERVLDNEFRVQSGQKVEFTCRLIPLSESEQRAIQRTISRNQNNRRNQTPSNNRNVNIGTIDNVEVGPYKIHGQQLLNKIRNGQQNQNGSQSNNAQQQNNQQQQQQRTPEIDTGVLIFQLGSQVIKKVKVQDKRNWQKYSISLNDIKNKVFDRIIFLNKNTLRRVEFKDLKITDNKRRLRPKHYISKARNAIIKYNGVRITRQTNNIEKLLPGITLNIKKRTNGVETLSVEHDTENLTKKIEELIIHYNNAMDFIYKVTKYKRRQELKIRLAEMEKMKNMDDDKKTKLALTGDLYEGVLGGDMTVYTIKKKLREVMTNPYPTSVGNKIKFFVQVGLRNPKFTSNASQEERRNMRAGYFEFDRNKFKKMINKYFQGVKDLFANDTDGDLRRDNGISIKLNQALQYIASNNYRGNNGRVYPGLIENRISVTKSYLKRRKKETKRFEKRIARKRRSLIDKIRRAEQAQYRANRMRQRLNAFSNPGQGGQ